MKVFETIRMRGVLRGKGRADGYALVTVIALSFVASALVASYLSISVNENRNVRLNIDRQKAELVAEIGLDYGVAKLREVIFDYRLSPHTTQAQLQAVLDAIPAPPAMPPYVYERPSGQPAFRIIVQSPVYQGLVTSGSAFRGVNASIQQFSIVVGVRNTESIATSVLRQDLQALSLALIRFGVFYNQDLEIVPGATMSLSGPVHSNADLYIGGQLRFLDRVTAVGDIIHRRKNTGARDGQAQAVDENNILRSFRLPDGTWVDNDSSNWMLDSLQRWNGTIQSGDHGVSRLSPPISPMDEPYTIIQRPLASTNAQFSAMTEKEKFHNKAGLIIHVDATGHLFATNGVGAPVTNLAPATLQMAGSDPVKDAEGRFVMATNGTHEITNSRFFDARENRWVSPVDIYVDQLQEFYPQLYTGTTVEEGRGIVYITRDDPGDGSMPAVRLRNGGAITNTFGMSIVSDLPVYVEGHYNTSNTVPALVAGDAVTLLSRNWRDSTSNSNNTDIRRAESTDFNAVIMTGNTETIPGVSYNGGLENVLRFLENWSNRTAYFRGSIICLWHSRVAHGPWAIGTVAGRFRYSAPIRNWGYDNIYRTQSPPGITHVFGMEETAWTRTTWAEQGW
jgi:hypothetical protein